MKIKKSELIELIKEEAQRINKLRALTNEKAEIQRQLQEMYGMGEIDEAVDAATIAANKQRFEQALNDRVAQLAQKKIVSATPIEQILQKAAADNYAGTVNFQQNKQRGTANFGKVFLIYTPAPLTGLAKVGAAMGTAIRGGHTFGGGAPE